MSRILVYGLVDSKTFGGIGSFLTEMNRHMSDDTVFDYVIEGSSCSIQDRIEEQGGKIYYITKRTKNPFLNLRDNRNILKSLRETHDTVYFNLSTLGWIEPIKIAISLGYRVFVHSHNSRLIVDDAKHRFVYNINKRRLSKLKVTRLSCSKKATEFMYFPNDQVQFIHNAVDIDMFKFNEEERIQVRNELKISDSTKVIGFVGRLVDQKNVLFLPEILKSIIEQYDNDVVMMIIGEGNLRDKLQEKVVALNLQDRCFILGDRSDISRYYKAMDVFVLPSLYEGLPIVMVEAQVSGLPCIVSDVITSESNISGNVTFLPIDDASIWGKVIFEKLNDNNTNRELMSEMLKDSDFDINHKAFQLENILTEKDELIYSGGRRLNNTVVIGQLHFKKNDMIGAVVKTRNIYYGLLEKYGENLISYVDIWGGKKRIPIVFADIFKAFLKCENVILVTSAVKGPFVFYIRLLQKIFRRRVIYVPIGVRISGRIANDSKARKRLSFCSAILPESKLNCRELQSMGFPEVCLFRNFKSVKKLGCSYKSLHRNMKVFSFCTFSRVTKDKGITDAIIAISKVQELVPNIRFELHIYGGIDPEYKEEFELLLSDNSFVTYEGSVNSEEAVSTLQKHDVLLFPTRFPDEGIPGTIIDAFASGIPIISSKWLYFDELFEDHKTALGYDFLNVDSLVDTIIYATKNTEELVNIGRNGQKEYGKYDSSAVLPVLVNQLL